MKRLQIVLSTTAAILLYSPPALAYVDPGSGTLIIQLLVAAGVGAMFYFRQFREKVKSLFTRRGRDAGQEANSVEDDIPN
jgi:hypothetical protein